MTDIQNWRGFIGGWSDGAPNRIETDAANLSWREARRVLLDFARDFTDECPHCMAQRDQAMCELINLREGEGFEGAIDWDALVLPVGKCPSASERGDAMTDIQSWDPLTLALNAVVIAAGAVGTGVFRVWLVRAVWRR